MKHIFVVEDDLITRRTIALILRKRGFKVSGAGNLRDGVKRIRSLNRGNSPIDLIIVDVQIPDATCVELIRDVQRHNLKTPVLAMTGYADKALVVHLIRLGCSDCLDKPFYPNELLLRIKNIFSRIDSIEKIPPDLEARVATSDAPVLEMGRE